MASFPVYGDVDEFLRHHRRRKRRRIHPVGGGLSIELSNLTISDAASIGDLVGTLSVPGGTGSETFTLTDDAGGLFSISGTSLEVAAALTTGSYSITVQSNTGLTRSFTITVTHDTSYSPSLDFSDARNSMYLPVAA